MQTDVVEAPKLLDTMFQQGVVLGLEVRSVLPPAVRGTLVLPGAGTQPEPFLSTMRLIAGLAEIQPKETKIEGRRVSHFAEEGINLFWWIEGEDAVLVIGTDTPADFFKTLKGPTLLDSPLYKKVRDFKEFETALRGFVDLASLVKVAQSTIPPVAQLLNELGLEGLRNVTFVSGFEGDTERNVIQLELAGPYKGVLRLADVKPFQLSDLPPMPADLTSFAAMRLDLAGIYDHGLKAIEAIVAVASPRDLPEVKEGISQIDKVLGFNLRNELLGSVGDLFILYNSPAEGPLTFGQTALLPVKDPAKVHAAIAQLVKVVAAESGSDIQLKKRTFHGVDTYELHVREEGFIFLPTYTIHKGWLAISFYPQPVQGFILRSNGELPPWKPDERARQALDKLPKDMVFVSVADPRPTVKQILAIAPLFMRAINSFSNTTVVDVGSLPNGNEVAQHLFTNVAVGSKDGDTFRLENRASLTLPMDLAGMDSYIVFFFFFAVARF
jgi:hypothetical protein